MSEEDYKRLKDLSAEYEVKPSEFIREVIGGKIKKDNENILNSYAEMKEVEESLRKRMQDFSLSLENLMEGTLKELQVELTNKLKEKLKEQALEEFQSVLEHIMKELQTELMNKLKEQALKELHLVLEDTIKEFKKEAKHLGKSLKEQILMELHSELKTEAKKLLKDELKAQTKEAVFYFTVLVFISFFIVALLFGAGFLR